MVHCGISELHKSSCHSGPPMNDQPPIRISKHIRLINCDGLVILCIPPLLSTVHEQPATVLARLLALLIIGKLICSGFWHHRGSTSAAHTLQHTIQSSIQSVVCHKYQQEWSLMQQQPVLRRRAPPVTEPRPTVRLGDLWFIHFNRVWTVDRKWFSIYHQQRSGGVQSWPE